MFFRILIMCLMITALPFLAGIGLTPEGEKVQRVLQGWILGQVLLWALFLLVCVPETLLGRMFSSVLLHYGILSGCLVLFSVLRFFLERRLKNKGWQEKNSLDQPVFRLKKEGSKGTFFLWAMVVLLFVLQCILVFLLQYEEGDDSFYVAITATSAFSDKLYTVYPYTGFTTELTARYAMAPFPVWVAILARISGLSGAATSHVVMPPLIMGLTYGIYYLIGERLLGRNRKEKPWSLPLYLLLVELLVLFGGYSSYSRENFLLVRAGQGKAVLANVIIPSLFYLLMLLYERLEEKKATGILTWAWIAVTLAAGCLCSTLGSFLLCLLLGLGVACGAIAYGRWKLFLGVIPCLAVPCAIIILYLHY